MQYLTPRASYVILLGKAAAARELSSACIDLGDRKAARTFRAEGAGYLHAAANHRAQLRQLPG